MRDMIIELHNSVLKDLSGKTEEAKANFNYFKGASEGVTLFTEQLLNKLEEEDVKSDKPRLAKKKATKAR